MTQIKETALTILVFKTNVSGEEEYASVAALLNECKDIVSWNIDREDIDKVLRVEANGIKPEEIGRLITDKGFYCEELKD